MRNEHSISQTEGGRPSVIGTLYIPHYTSLFISVRVIITSSIRFEIYGEGFTHLYIFTTCLRAGLRARIDCLTPRLDTELKSNYIRRANHSKSIYDCGRDP